jgi:hypothetical protein
MRGRRGRRMRVSDSVSVKYPYVTQTLKYDNILVKYLFLIPFAPLRSL